MPAHLFKNHQASQPGPALKDWKLEPILPALADRAVQFISQCAAKNEPFLLYLPLTAPHTPLAVNDAWKGKSQLHTFADFVMETDSIVGRVLASLEQSGAASNTLVIFTSDNGCAPYIGVKELEAHGHFPSGPLRGYKADVYEGGHRVPLLIRWPGVIKPGSVSHQLVHHADVLATLADIFGTALPDNAGEDSFSLLPLLRGEDKPVRFSAISCASSGVPGLREGSWKYIPQHEVGGAASAEPRPQPEQLYNLANDLGEMSNLADSDPDRVARMRKLLEKLISDGRSTPGPRQPNDVRVVRYPRPTKAARSKPTN